MRPTREIYWHIPGHVWLYALFAITAIVFLYGVYRRLRLWKLGRSENRFDQPARRFKAVFFDGLLQRSILRETEPGLMHAAIFFSFVLLTIGTILVMLQADLSIKILFGNFYLWYSLVLDIAGVVFLLGVLYALVRRYLIRPARLNRVTDDAIILGGLLIIGVSGFLLEGMRISATNPAWQHWSPVGKWMAGIFSGVTEGGLIVMYQRLWWGHLLLTFFLIAYIPFSKLFHVLTSPTNIYFKSLGPKAELEPIDYEKSETFGVSTIREFTWKQLFDLDACISCGRCQEVCPAFISEKPLSPKKIILDLKDCMAETGAVALAGKKAAEQSQPEEIPLIMGNRVEEEEVWSCTTCLACQEACPVAIEHVRKIVDLRRSLVLMDGKFPQELNPAFKGLETNANPWGLGSSTRAEWRDELGEGVNVPTIAEAPDADYLWFVGCAGSFDDRAVKISKSLAAVLNAAGVSVAVLGVEEKCCGDPARRAGNEYVADNLARDNVATFTKYGVKKIVTSCPHCFNMLKNEYPKFGGNYQVVHHSQLIEQLIREGKLALKTPHAQKAAFHDSCYLGRYNDIYQEPREVLRAVTGAHPVELKRSRERSFCCGAGGGRMWMEEDVGKRINHLRTQEIIDSGVATVSVACPFCLIMLDDGVKEKEKDESIEIVDVAQLVEKAL